MSDVHAVAIEMLQEDPRLHETTLTKLYMKATNVPPEIAPILIDAFRKAEAGKPPFSYTWYEAAIINLKKQCS